MEGRPTSLYIASKRGLKRLNTSKAQAFDFPDGVVFGNPGIDVDHGHKLPLGLLPASHARFSRCGSLIPDLFSVFHQPASLASAAREPIRGRW
jgi:hypothetical protein